MLSKFYRGINKMYDIRRTEIIAARQNGLQLETTRGGRDNLVLIMEDELFSALGLEKIMEILEQTYLPQELQRIAERKAKGEKISEWKKEAEARQNATDRARRKTVEGLISFLNIDGGRYSVGRNDTRGEWYIAQEYRANLKLLRRRYLEFMAQLVC